MEKLPKEYISWSSLELWEKSPKTWYKKYVLGQKTFETKHLQKGKEFADAVEDDISEDLIIKEMLPYIQKLDVMEMEISAIFENDIFPGLKLLGKKDTGTGVEKFREYKTGSKPWTQERANAHGQLAFYALIDKLNGATVMPEIWLDWFEVVQVVHTRQDGSTYKTVEFTGHFESFEVKLKAKDIANMEKRILKALKEIAAYEYVEVLEFEDSSAFKRYARLDRLEKLMVEEKKKIKENIEEMLKLSGCQEAESDAGKFYLKNNPPQWQYSAALTKKIAAVKALQTTEQKTGTAKKTQGQSLTWQPIK